MPPWLVGGGVYCSTRVVVGGGVQASVVIIVVMKSAEAVALKFEIWRGLGFKSKPMRSKGQLDESPLITTIKPAPYV